MLPILRGQLPILRGRMGSFGSAGCLLGWLVLACFTLVSQ
jgi:hypothetical protein